MRPDERDLDDEIRGHLALSIKERVDRGEDPAAARRAALAEFGYVPQMRDAMRRVWYSRWFEAAMALALELRVAFRSLRATKGLAATVVVTLALGIGANAAIFSVVRGVLLRPLVNRDEDRLVYIRQSAPGLATANLTFSVPEIEDFKAGSTTIATFGDFSTIDFTLLGIGEPRVVKAGVVSGSYFEVMGLRPILGRLLTREDDGPRAAPVAVLTHRFWSTALQSDAGVVGRSIRLGGRNAVVVGVLEPSVPYPADTEIIANVVTSPHHLGATMVTGRTHRMTELFGRLAPGASVESARAELTAMHTAMMGAHPESYTAQARTALDVTPLREQIAAPARTILLLLLGASGIVFIIACANVANLILARSVHRQSELAVRAALGASHGALRRTLLGESLVLCGAGAVLGVALAQPLVAVVARFAARFSMRALEVTVDGSLLWMGAGLAIAAAVLLAYIPRLPSAHAPAGFGLSQGGLRVTPGTNRRLRGFAMTQVACSFVLLAAAGMLLAALVALQRAPAGVETRQVLAVDLPTTSVGVRDAKEMALYQEMTARVAELPGVTRVALGNFVPWRDAGSLGSGFRFAVEGFTPNDGEEDPIARLRVVSPGFFDVLAVPFLAGRDFDASDRDGGELAVIVSQSVADRLVPDGSVLNRRMWWTDPYFGKPVPRRIVGVVGDVNDETIEGTSAMTVYHPMQQLRVAGRLFIQATGDPYALVPAVTRVVRALSPTQPVERAATLADVRTEILAPERLHAFVLSGFAGVALLIAVVGVAGVLAFSVSARTREFGVRLAIGSTPQRLLLRVLSEGALIAGVGIAAGGVGGYTLALVARFAVDTVPLPSATPTALAVAVLAAAAILASLLPAARAARIDVLRALRAE